MEAIFLSNLKFYIKNTSLKLRDLKYKLNYVLVELNHDKFFYKC